MKNTWLKKKFDYWRYLGYDKETLALYEHKIASDNLKISAGFLGIAAFIILAELSVVFSLLLTDNDKTRYLTETLFLLIGSLIILALITIRYFIVGNKPEKKSYSRSLTTLLLTCWSLMHILFGTIVNRDTYSVIACGMFLLIQVVFDAYPLENFTFALSMYVLFIALSFASKSQDYFVLDALDALLFLILGNFFSWIKSRSKWSALINADVKVQLETQVLEHELNNARISVMLSQIQPHFLYNSLTAISVLCDQDPKKAKQATIDFSRYLRANLDSLKQNDPLPFETELRHVENYLKLEKMRFNDNLTIVYDIQTTDFLIPALTVQPLVENAVKYGVGQREDGGTIKVATCEEKDFFVVCVSDDGVGYDLSKPQFDGRSHIGIDNVRKRVSVMCNGTLEIQSTKNVGSLATIKIPKGENHGNNSYR